MTIAFALTLAASSAPAVAQTNPDAPPSTEPAPPPQRDDILVTGRRVAGSVISSVPPVAVLDSAALRSLGVTSMADVMKRLQGASTSASGGEPAILLNGRRVSGFEDLQSLPPEAIDRVEILPEQEAARFGFPPTMRVMNFITKRHFRSLTLQQLAGSTTEGGGATDYTELNATRIEGPRRTSLGLSYFRQNPLLQSQRDIRPDPDALFAIPGNVAGVDGGSIDPALDALAGRPVTVAGIPQDPAARRSLSSYVGSPRAVTDLGPFRTLQASTDTLRLDGTLASPIGKKLDGSLNLSLQADRNTSLNGLAAGILRVPGGSNDLPFTDPTLVYRYFPGIVLRQQNTSLAAHAGVTLQGGLKRWAWSFTSAYDRGEGQTRSGSGIALDALQAGVDAGGDPLAALDPASPARRIVARSRTSTDTVSTKAVANGPLVHLPAGDAQLTVSADYSRSSSNVRGDDATTDIGAVSRSIAGISVNASLPIASASQGVLPFLGQLSLSGTLGLSDVSKYGRLLNSNLGLTWSPARPVQLSASITETRTAPDITQLTNPLLTAPNTPFFDFTTGSTVSVTSLLGGNPNLAPERRRAMSLGVALQPIKDKEFRLTLDYVDTQIDNQAGTLGSVTPAFQAAFPDLFARDAAGRLVSVDLRPVNLARERERKLRATVSLQTALGPAPAAAPPPAKDAPPPRPPKERPSIYVNFTTNFRFDDRLTLRDGLPALDLLDGATINGTGGRPRWDVDGTIAGSYGPVNLGVYGRLQGPTRIKSDLASSDLRFSGRTWLVLYSFVDIDKVLHRPWSKRLSVQFTVENLLNDRIDVRDRNGATPNRFQAAYLDPLGRSIRLGLRKLF
ncbi:MAG TPA: TonB-dependent receptor [Sphingomonas sp.]